MRYLTWALLAGLLLTLLLLNSKNILHKSGKSSAAPAFESTTHQVPTLQYHTVQPADASKDASDPQSDKPVPAAGALNDTSVAVPIGELPVHAPAALPPAQSPVASKPQFDVVIAHYHEDPHYIKVWTDTLRSVPYVQELGIRIIIYTKGDMDLSAIKEVSGAEEVIRLPNVGREGSTHLHHILKVYDNPPQFMLFTQAQIKKGQQEGSGKMVRWLEDRLQTKFANDTGFMSLDKNHVLCHCGWCKDMKRNDDFYPMWPQLYSILEGRVCQQREANVLSFNSHFIVSRRRILERPRSIYEYLQDLVDAPQDHWIHAEPEPKWFDKHKGKSVPSNPKFGHTLERLWHTIFRCDTVGEVEDCDVKGRKDEAPGGCSCRDFPESLPSGLPGSA